MFQYPPLANLENVVVPINTLSSSCPFCGEKYMSRIVPIVEVIRQYPPAAPENAPSECRKSFTVTTLSSVLAPAASTSTLVTFPGKV